MKNSFFNKQENRKRTWRSLDRRTKNKIDFIIGDRKSSVRDISVLNIFYTGMYQKRNNTKLKKQIVDNMITTKLSQKPYPFHDSGRHYSQRQKIQAITLYKTAKTSQVTFQKILEI